MSFPSLLFLMVLSYVVEGLENGLGLTPPMGYSTWFDVGCNNISESYIISVADRLVSSGLANKGYEYINIDDCWQISRDKKTHKLIPDPKAFPSGIAWLSQVIHSKNLKIGLYTDRGRYTCQKKPGSINHEILDAQTFADWEIDFLKEDSCYATSIVHSEAIREYSLMSQALNATGRKIFFSICGWFPWYAKYGKNIGNSWRISTDNTNWIAIFLASREMQRLYKYSGPGGWNDPDFLLGSDQLATNFVTARQSRTQFSLWCVMAAPLILSSSGVFNRNSFDSETYSNAKAIAINQDPLGVPGRVLLSNCPLIKSIVEHLAFPPDDCTEIWYKSPLKNQPNSFALVFVNWDPKKDLHVTCNAACMMKAGMPKRASIASIVDVWSDDGDDSNNNFVYTPPSLENEGTLTGPGKIETFLNSDGGSAFLIVEWSLVTLEKQQEMLVAEM